MPVSQHFLSIRISNTPWKDPLDINSIFISSEFLDATDHFNTQPVCTVVEIKVVCGSIHPIWSHECPADDDGSLVKDRDGGHLAGSGSADLPGASHSDLAGIRSSDDEKNPKNQQQKNRKGEKAGEGHMVSPYAC